MVITPENSVSLFLCNCKEGLYFYEQILESWPDSLFCVFFNPLIPMSDQTEMLTISIQNQEDEWWEPRKVSIRGLKADLIANSRKQNQKNCRGDSKENY